MNGSLLVDDGQIPLKTAEAKSSAQMSKKECGEVKHYNGFPRTAPAILNEERIRGKGKSRSVWSRTKYCYDIRRDSSVNSPWLHPQCKSDLASSYFGSVAIQVSNKGTGVTMLCALYGN